MFLSRSSLKRMLPLLLPSSLNKSWRCLCSNKTSWDIDDINSDIARVVGPFAPNNETLLNNVDSNNSGLHYDQSRKWDIDILNSELEEIVGKFDKENETSLGVHEKSTTNETFEQSKSSIIMSQSSLCDYSRSIANASLINEDLSSMQINVLILRPSVFGLAEELSHEKTHRKFANIVEFHACDESLTNLMSLLASSNFDGIIIARNDPKDKFSKAISDLLKICSKSKPVVLIENAPSNSLEDNMTWVNYVIRGFDNETERVGKATAIMMTFKSDFV